MKGGKACVTGYRLFHLREQRERGVGTMKEKLKSAVKKVKKVRKTKWKMLTTGEKFLKIAMWALAVFLLCTIGIVIGVIILAIVIAVGLMNGMTGAVNDQIRRNYEYRHRPRNDYWY